MVTANHCGGRGLASIQVSATPISSVKAKVKKTGQIYSHYNFDDGYYQKGKVHSYTQNANVIIDNVTGLM